MDSKIITSSDMVFTSNLLGFHSVSFHHTSLPLLCSTFLVPCSPCSLSVFWRRCIFPFVIYSLPPSPPRPHPHALTPTPSPALTPFCHTLSITPSIWLSLCVTLTPSLRSHPSMPSLSHTVHNPLCLTLSLCPWPHPPQLVATSLWISLPLWLSLTLLMTLFPSFLYSPSVSFCNFFHVSLYKF